MKFPRRRKFKEMAKAAFCCQHSGNHSFDSRVSILAKQRAFLAIRQNTEIPSDRGVQQLVLQLSCELVVGWQDAKHSASGSPLSRS